MSRYQFSSIMMVLWAVMARLQDGVWYLVPLFVSTLYFVDALAALWKSRKERTP